MQTFVNGVHGENVEAEIPHGLHDSRGGTCRRANEQEQVGRENPARAPEHAVARAMSPEASKLNGALAEEGTRRRPALALHGPTGNRRRGSRNRGSV